MSKSKHQAGPVNCVDNCGKDSNIIVITSLGIPAELLEGQDSNFAQAKMDEQQ